MVAPQPPRKRRSSSLNIAVGAFAAMYLLSMIIVPSTHEQVADSSSNNAERSPILIPVPITALQSPDLATSSPATANRRQITGAFANCLAASTQEDRFFFPHLHDHSVVVSCHKLHYKLPPSLSRNRFFVYTEVSVPVNIVIGILSASWESSRRDAIRTTWGKDVVNRYFVVGGIDFGAVHTEFHKHGDVIWIDMEENYEELMYKTGAMLGMFQRHIQGLQYVLKTDDDSYINVEELQKELVDGGEGFRQEYFGHCHVNRTIPYRPFQLNKLPPYFQKFIVNKTVYPEKWNAPYCQGAGYIVGPSFLKCIAQEVPFIRYHPFEDVAIGLMAERCKIAAVRHAATNDYKWHFEVGEASLSGKILQHPVESAADMQARHKTLGFTNSVEVKA